MFNQTVTLYCRHAQAWHRCVLRGVYADAVNARSFAAAQLREQDRALLVIPAAVAGYVPPQAYAGQEGSFTLRVGDVFCLGEQTAASPHEVCGEDSFIITAAANRMHGGRLAHREAGGGRLRREGGGMSL